MRIAVNTGFLTDDAFEQDLELVVEAGFTHLHWAHQWCTDFLYGPAETEHYAARLKGLGLRLLDIHGSVGHEKCWFSLEEFRRRAGVELVLNRVRLLKELGGAGAVMMHIPGCHSPDLSDPDCLERRQAGALRRSLDELMPALERYDATLALENGWFDSSFEIIAPILRDYPARRLGLVYDSGHGNILPGHGLDHLEMLRDRLVAVHLNDNDGRERHQPPYMGTVDWPRLARILADSSYRNPLSFEISIRHTPFFDPDRKDDQTLDSQRAFLADARRRAARFIALARPHE